jgi:hypothetical protein
VNAATEIAIPLALPPFRNRFSAMRRARPNRQHEQTLAPPSNPADDASGQHHRPVNKPTMCWTRSARCRQRRPREKPVEFAMKLRLQRRRLISSNQRATAGFAID